MRRQRWANLPPSTTCRQSATASARTAAVTSRSCRSSSVVPSASPTPASTPPASATPTSTICCSMASPERQCPLSLWERAGVRGAYELERLRSYAPLTRAARGLSQRERHSGNAQVGALDADVGQQLGAAAFADDVALFEDVAAVSQLERHARVLLDQQDGQAALVDGLQHAEDVANDERRQPEAGLVEQQQSR